MVKGDGIKNGKKMKYQFTYIERPSLLPACGGKWPEPLGGGRWGVTLANFRPYLPTLHTQCRPPIPRFAGTSPRQAGRRRSLYV